MWFQRSTEDWISSEIETHFYHMATTIKKNNNRISHLKDSNGTLVDDKDIMKYMIRNYFLDIFT